MGKVRAIQKWLLRSIVDVLLDLICTQVEPSGESELFEVLSIAELAKTLVISEGESARAQPTRSILGPVAKNGASQIEWSFSDQLSWSRGNNG